MMNNINKFVIFSIFTCFFIACNEPIMHDLNELEANRLFAKLHASNINPQKLRQPDGNWTISVPPKAIFSAIQLLEDHRFFKKTNKLPKTAKLLSSNIEQELEYKNTLSQQLESTLNSMKGVFEVHVHLNLPIQKSLWDLDLEQTKVATAAVLLIVDHDFNNTEDEIREIVFGAVGVKKENVAVVINYPALFSNSKQEPKEQQAFKAILDDDNQAIEKRYYYLFSALILVLSFIFLFRRNQHSTKNFKEKIATISV